MQTTTTEAPTIEVHFLTPVCDGDVPYLAYSVAVTGTPNTTATITFIGAGGETFAYENQPLVGRVLWPGAVVGANGEPLDWPGWTQQPDGSWMEGDEWDWTRPQVTVTVEVNPTASGVVGYPPATPLCDANPPSPPPPGVTTTTTAPTPQPGQLPPTR